MKRCKVCDFVKPLSEFYSGNKSTCKTCIIERTLKWQSNNPEQEKNNILKRKYNLTLDEMNEMVKQQGNRCAICGDVFQDSKSTHVDHCHKTNDVRGILCHHCNTGLGHFRDSKKLLKEAINYLKDHAEKRAATLISEGHNIQGELYPELGVVSGTWLGEDCDGAHHSGGAQDEDAGDSPTESSSECLGAGVSEVGAPKPHESKQNNGQSSTAYIWLES